MSELSEAEAVRRVCDRLGFGAGGEQLAAAQQAGFAATVRDFLEPSGPDAGVTATPYPQFERLARPGRGQRGQQPDPAERQERRAQRREQQQALVDWWLERMVRVEQPTAERLTWFWHGHFATSLQKVKDATLMLGQNETMRRAGRGSFTALAQAMVIDPAMLVWLDGNDNTAQAPNENLSRELLELFTLGHGSYTESDVREGARALTGWRINRNAGAVGLRRRLHDAGSKRIFGVEGHFDARSLIELVLGQPAAPAFLVSRLWFRLVSTSPPGPEARERLLPAYGPQRDVTALLRALAAEPAFVDPASSLVKQPVEWLVGLMRALGVAPSALEPRQQKRLVALLRGMGQVPFRPPSVGGWPAGGAWLTGAAALSRLEAARLVGSVARFDAATSRAPTSQRPEAVRRLLGVDTFSPRTAAAVAAVPRLSGAVAVAACAPEYVVSR